MKGLIFTYALTYGGALVSLVNPYVGLLIYLCFAIVKPEAMWYWSVPRGNYSRIVAIALLTGWLIQGFGRWRFGRATGIVAALIGFLLWSALSAAAAAEAEPAWGFVEEATKIVLPFVVGITTIHTVRQLRQLAWVIVLSQGYVALEMNLSYYGGLNRVHELGFCGMDNNCVAITMVTCTGLALFLGLHETRRWLRAVALVAALLMVHTVLFAFSRGGMLSLILTALVSFWLIPKRPAHFAVFAAVVLVGVRLAGPEVQKRFQTTFADPSERDASAESRLKLWADCGDVILKHPLLGVGPRHWPLIAPAYGWPVGKEAHTLWLQVGAELGLPGLLCLVLFYGLCVVRLRPLARESSAVPDPWLRYLARAVIASICGFALAAQFVSLVGLEAPYYIALIGAATLKLASLPAAEAPPAAPAVYETAGTGGPVPTLV
jgi:probable O-glycosylation ligase (exosortase A-associated)